MARPTSVGLGDWNEMVSQFHSESDRGAAIIAGSFVEHALGTYLVHRVKDKAIAEKLFGPVGPLSSFSQRIAVAYAFGLVTEREYKDLEAVRQVRNHFAHHPSDASFLSEDVQKHTRKLTIYHENIMGPDLTEKERHRIAFLITCGLTCGRLLDEIERGPRGAP